MYVYLNGGILFGQCYEDTSTTSSGEPASFTKYALCLCIAHVETTVQAMYDSFKNFVR